MLSIGKYCLEVVGLFKELSESSTAGKCLHSDGLFWFGIDRALRGLLGINDGLEEVTRDVVASVDVEVEALENLLRSDSFNSNFPIFSSNFPFFSMFLL